MMSVVSDQRPWSELGVDPHGWVVSGVFRIGDATYNAEFSREPELARFFDFLLAAPHQPPTSRMYRHRNVVPVRHEHMVSNLRFQFDREHDRAAAVLLVIDNDNLLSWMTVSDPSTTPVRSDLVLAHDSWNEHETLFPPASQITISQLRTIVTQWAFGDLVPPSVGLWAPVTGIGWL